MPDSPQYNKELELYTLLRKEGMGFLLSEKSLPIKA